MPCGIRLWFRLPSSTFNVISWNMPPSSTRGLALVLVVWSSYCSILFYVMPISFARDNCRPSLAGLIDWINRICWCVIRHWLTRNKNLYTKLATNCNYRVHMGKRLTLTGNWRYKSDVSLFLSYTEYCSLRKLVPSCPAVYRMCFCASDCFQYAHAHTDLCFPLRSQLVLTSINFRKFSEERRRFWK